MKGKRRKVANQNGDQRDLGEFFGGFLWRQYKFNFNTAATFKRKAYLEHHELHC